MMAQLGLPVIVAAWTFETTSRVFAVSAGIVCAIIAIVLFISSRTKWGQNKPLTKCIALAVLAHVWLLMYAYGTRYTMPGPGSRYGDPHGSLHPSATTEATISSLSFDEQPNGLSVLEELPVPTTLPATLRTSLADKQVNAQDVKGSDPDLARSPSEQSESHQSDGESSRVAEEIKPSIPPVESNEPQTPQPTPEPSPVVAEARTPEAMPIPATTNASIDRNLTNPRSDIVVPDSTPSSALPGNLPSNLSGFSQMAVTRTVGSTPIQFVPPVREPTQPPVPDMYQLRLSPQRSQTAMLLGGDQSTEAAVEAALVWLASVQEPDGSWNAAKHGAGRETKTLERDRKGTGSKSDTGMTALSLLAFLGAGNTHLEGKYRNQVADGLQFLMRSQMPSGDLAGLKQIGMESDVRYARMYCHGMSTLAIAEAYAMTGDSRLYPVMEKAAGYTLRAQNPKTGGWRYDAFVSGDPGDMSQFGWQAMALSSCENGRVSLPVGSRQKMFGFLDSVSSGQYGGLAVYRPVPGQVPTPAMTAEAFAMRMLLGYPLSVQGEAEAKAMILKNLPGQSEENWYYWYYASLALFPFQDADWERWNTALKNHLTQSQVVSGPDAGSWDTRCIWAGYGGRIYSTAIACLSMEVYYRYLPIYRSNVANGTYSPDRR